MLPEDRAAAVRTAVAKILASPHFSASARMCRFLRFAVERALEGRGRELKEYAIGLEIFDRPPTFDPRIDPIVRVEARRLRSKLKAYYLQQGRGDEIVIELPTGTYAPCFRTRTAGVPGGQANSVRPATTVAVLPFANLASQPDSEYFSDGLSEELIHALTKVDGLRVVAWRSAEKFRDRQEDFRAAGEELGVGAVLTGSVRRAGGRVRIAARLVDTASGAYMWSEVYDRQLEDLFAIEQEISRAIVASLKARLLGGPERAAAPSVDAYDLYLRGRFHWNRRTREGLELAIGYFNQSIEADPEYAAAHAGLADALTLLADHGLAAPAEVMPKAKAAALRALELDGDSVEAHTSLGLIVAAYEWQWAEAERHYRRAIALGPGYATAHHWYGCDLLAILGRFDEAIAEMREAQRLDPLSRSITETFGYVYLLARRYDDALAEYRKAAELDPYFYKAYTAVGRLCIHTGKPEEAIAMLRKGRELAGELPALLGALGQAYAVAGRPGDARAQLAKLEAMDTERYVPATAFAMVHAGLGDAESALAHLERGCERRDLPLMNLKVHPGYDALRRHPRFEALLARMGLAD